MMEKELIWNFNSLSSFYEASNKVLPTGNAQEWEKQNSKSNYNAGWVGLPWDDIESCKWRYNKPVQKITNQYENILTGGSDKIKVWSETDGYDLNYDRLIDGFPALQNIIRKIGKSNGKFVTLHVNIGENCHVSAENMANKAMTAMQIIDILEESGLRVQIKVSEISHYPGKLEKTGIDTLETNIVVKRFEDVLNKSLIFTAVSPWTLRYHWFKLVAARIQPNSGYGSSVSFKKKINDISHIYIDNQECLEENTGLEKIKQIIKINKS